MRPLEGRLLFISAWLFGAVWGGPEAGGKNGFGVSKLYNEAELNGRASYGAVGGGPIWGIGERLCKFSCDCRAF